jgi:hypothetical protein
MKLISASLLHHFQLIVATVAVSAGCVESPESPDTSAVASAGMLNGMLNGFLHTEGLGAFLAGECPLLHGRLLESGNLAQALPPTFVAEIAKPACERFMFYTAQLMVPFGQSLTLSAAGAPVASFAGAMGLQHLVAQVHPQYTFSQHAFLPAYPAARKIVTQGYATLTNGITRKVSYKTNVPELDAHRAPIEDAWPRELLQLVPFTPAGLAAMASDPDFLARLPDFFNACAPHLTNYDYLTQPAAGSSQLPLPEGYCPVPVVVRGNLDFVEDAVPGRSCRILSPGESVTSGTTVSGDVLVPDGGCPLIYYAGRDASATVYDDRLHNPPGTADGCNVTGPSTLTNCHFDVALGGVPVPADYIAHYVFNVEPLSL